MESEGEVCSVLADSLNTGSGGLFHGSTTRASLNPSPLPRGHISTVWEVTARKQPCLGTATWFSLSDSHSQLLRKIQSNAERKRKYRKGREKLNEPGFSPPSLILPAKLLSREWIIPALNNPQQHRATGGEGEIRYFSCWLSAFQGVFYLFKKPHSSSI